MRTLGAAAGVRRTAYALHARGLRLCRLLLGYASVLMSFIGILYYKCILYSVEFQTVASGDGTHARGPGSRGVTPLDRCETGVGTGIDNTRMYGNPRVWVL